MAFNRPTLRELIQQLTTDAEREAGAQQLRQSNLRVLPKVFAFAIHSLYGFIAWILRQLFADTAEAKYLERQASIQGIFRREASKATGSLTVTRTPGAQLPVGTVFQTSDQIRYSTTAEPEAEGTTVPVECQTAGIVGNRSSGETFTLVAPVAGVDAEATGSEMAGGAEAETDESLRQRLLYRLRNPPRGGTASDYVAWALEVPGVTRAWSFPKELGIGTVTVRFATDGLTENGVPTEGMVELVSQHIESVAPVTAATTVVAPQAHPVNITISDLTPDTEAVRAQIEAELRDLILRECVPGEVLLLSHIEQAVSSAAGEIDHRIVSPTEDVECPSNAILCLDEVIYE